MDVRICQHITERQGKSHWLTLHNPRWPMEGTITHTTERHQLVKGTHEQRTTIARVGYWEPDDCIMVWCDRGDYKLGFESASIGSAIWEVAKG